MTNMRKTLRVAVVIAFAGASLPGCALLTAAEKAVGRAAGKPIGTKIARTVAPPKTNTKPVDDPGRFCPTMRALGWAAFFPPPAMIDATPDREATILADTVEAFDRCTR